MWTRIEYATEVDIAYGVKLSLKGFADVGEKEIASAMRHLVATEFNGDDAGCDYFYDENEGVVCVAGEPGWWDSRNPLHIQLLKTADMLDGNDFSFNYALVKEKQLQ